MSVTRSPTIQKWWPLGQSLDLIEGSSKRVADAVGVELARILPAEKIRAEEVPCAGLGGVFSLVQHLATVPTLFVVVPTHSKWSVLLVNSALCDGYDSLCHCLAANHGLTTVHWSAHDDQTTFQPGAGFTHRRAVAWSVAQRSVQVAVNDGRWTFVEAGQPLPEEDTSLYASRRKRDRLNESSIQQLLERLGARPWSDDFYALPGQCHVLSRVSPPTTVKQLPVASVLSS